MGKILLADDDKIMLGLLTTLLKMEGDESTAVTRPEEVVPAARRECPDIILMDVHLIGGSALEALQTLKSDPKLQHIPVLMISGMDVEDQCRRMGADDFIMKPFRPSELLQRLHTTMENKDFSN
ncbi:MAG: response regulator [Chloroflexota bacterium]|nr:response regulator [Chloroflexota bacterium]